MTTQTDALGNPTTYTYDANGNKLTQSVTRTKYDGTKETLTTQYQYDGNGRLTKTIYPDLTFTQIQYNALGKQSDTFDQLQRHTQYAYDADGRLQKTTYADGTFEQTGYDNNGNRTSFQDRGGHVTSYFYDSLNRLTKTQFADDSYTQTVYNPDGTVQTSYDALRNATNSDTYDYDAFGNLINSTGSTPNNYLFAGEQYDPALNLYYNRARYLNTATGRYWSMDTEGGEDENPLSLHKYLFAEADAVDNRDESGNEIDEVIGSFAIAATLNSFPTLHFNAVVGSSASYPEIHELIAAKARSYEGSRRWFQFLTLSAHTGLTWDETCNKFVYDVLQEVGANPPKIFRPSTVSGQLYKLAFERLYQTPPLAHEWADPGFYLPFWEIVQGGSANAQPGDVIAEQHTNGGGHSGIVVGNRQTASASAVGLNLGKIVINDWGFRPDNYNGTGKAKDAVVRRFIGISDLGIGNGS